MKNVLWSKSWDSLINKAELGLRNSSPWGDGFTTEGNNWLRAPSSSDTDFLLNAFIESSACLCPEASQPAGLKVSFYAIPTAPAGNCSQSLPAGILWSLVFFLVMLRTSVYKFLIGKAPVLEDSFIFWSYELICTVKRNQRMGPLNNCVSLLNN